MNNLSPAWKSFKVSVNSLCSGDPDRRLKVRTLFRSQEMHYLHILFKPTLPPQDLKLCISLIRIKHFDEEMGVMSLVRTTETHG